MTESNPLKRGDVVRLKSGGPKMTVHSLQGAFATCKWFTEQEEIKDGDFVLASLERCPEDGKDGAE